MRKILFGLLAILATFTSGAIESNEMSGPNTINGFITFENGVDGTVISSSIPGLEFTNTNGFDWLYADCSTGNYNCPYPSGPYTVNGNIGAWLGTTQGDGRIDFTNGGATYLSVWVSAGEPVQLTAHYSNGQVADTASMLPNINTGQMTNLRVEAPAGDLFHYAIISGVGNYWVMDDLSTDADGVPNERNPLVFIPGITGSKFENDPDSDGVYDEVWPNVVELLVDPDDDSLLVLRLAENGMDPYSNQPAYTSVRVGDIVREELGIDFYQSTVDYYTNNGYTEGVDFIVCPYDWRRGLDEISSGILVETLDACIAEALAANPDSDQVNLLAHSMGGLVSRYYISDPTRAANVDRLVSLGTPYLGAPKIALAILDQLCFVERAGICFTSPETLRSLLVNFPSGYQLAPSDAFFQVYPNGYIRLDHDADGDGQNDGYLDIDDSFARLSLSNQLLAQNARSLLLSIGGWNNGSTNGVEVFMMVGDGFDSIGTIVEYRKTPWYNPWGSEIVFRTEVTNGDGTVPLRSADTRDLGSGINLSDEATVYYFNLSHEALATDYEVLQFAAAIFASSTPSEQTFFAQRMPDSPSKAPDTFLIEADNERIEPLAPRLEPIPLSGRFISINGPVRVEIFDSIGNRVGPIDSGGGYEISIPGASYHQLGESIFIFLPDIGVYDIFVYGDHVSAADVRIQNIEADELVQTALYDDLPIDENSVAWLSYLPSAANPGEFQLDMDGDGNYDGAFSNTAILDAEDSLDNIPPDSEISIEGTPSSDGWFIGNVTVSINAADNVGGTGVAKIEYSLDEGQTVLLYDGPFVVNADEVHLIFAKATDRAGNEESPFSFAGVVRNFLPIIRRQ